MRKKYCVLCMALLMLVVSCGKSGGLVEPTTQYAFEENETTMQEVRETTKNNIDTTIVYETTKTNETTEVLENKKYNSKDLLIFDDSEPKIIEEEILFDKKDEYPRVDGSTALLPLMAQVRSNALGISIEEAENDTNCAKTNEAWNNLFHGEADVLIVGEMPKEVRVELEFANEFRIEKKLEKRQILYAPVRREGLVFIVNKSNPVESLTKQQLIDIYTGKITNWKEVGGNDSKIEAFQREEKSGSQTIFRKILMKDIEPEAKERMYYPGEMNSLVDELASYDNSSNAIGYSVYYYVTQMYKNDKLKLLKVDGVEPNNETIANFSYPLLNESYTAIMADEPLNSNARKLYDYIRSNQGRKAVIQAGYVPVK